MTRICVSLTEERTAAVIAAMATLGPLADLFEVRADHVVDLDLATLYRNRSRPVLLTCRSEREGGRWPDADREGQRRILREGIERGFELVDVEARAGLDDLVASTSGRGIVLSWHDPERTPEDLDGLYERMAAPGPEVVKIAVRARSVADLGRLLDFARRCHATGSAEGRPALVAIAMGPLGVASRILGGAYGAPFTFAAPSVGREAAPGQLTAPVLSETYRVRRIGPSTRRYGILGSDVLRSLSPAIHNAAFAACGVDAVYVPLQAESAEAFLETLPRLGVSGFSVTRPYKSAILPGLDSVASPAAEAGSVNTVVSRDGRLLGLSTDGEGVLVPLRKRLEPSGRRIVVLGAGGAARAAAFALVRAGAHVSVLARRPEQAAQVASATGCAAAGPLGDVERVPWDVLVNATPAGSGACPGEMLVPPRALRPEKVVFDMVYEPRETPLLVASRAIGCRTIDGVEMLVAQAVGQFEAWTGREAPVEVMTRAAVEAIESARHAGAR